MTFKDWVLARDDYDLSRFVFTGLVPRCELARLLSVTDLHVYLTVPFVLSWSLLDALACGATVLASDTAPVREVIELGRNGLLVDFFDVEEMADRAAAVLDDPEGHAPLGLAGVAMIRERYSLDVCLPPLLDLYQGAVAAGPAGRHLTEESWTRASAREKLGNRAAGSWEARVGRHHGEGQVQESSGPSPLPTRSQGPGQARRP